MQDFFKGAADMELHVSDWYKSREQQDVMLEAGGNGLSRSVLGAHVIEKPELSEFLSGKEIVFTTGVALANDEELFKLAENSFMSGASALVLNTGKYINAVPEELKVFCSKNNFPLFTVPWSVHIETVIKSVYNLVAALNTESDKNKSVFESIMHNPSQYREYETALRELGFSPEWDYCVALIRPKNFNRYTNLSQIKTIYDALSLSASAGSFFFPYTTSDDVVLVAAKTTPKDIEAFIVKSLGNLYPEKTVFGIGRSTKSIRCLDKSYILATKILSMKASGVIPDKIVRYDELGIYRIIAGLENNDILNQIDEEYFAPLLDYDRLCGTDYVEFINTYLECDGHINKIAERMFIHKNTVHYKIRKIEEILDCDLSRYDVKMYLMIATMHAKAKNGRTVH